MKNNGNYRLWSITTQQYVVLKVRELDVNSKGEETDNWTKITSKERPSHQDRNSFYIVFENADGTDTKQYALHADIRNDEVSVQEFTGVPPSTAVAIVPQSFHGPFKALLIESDHDSEDLKYCIASERNGKLSVKKFNLANPHPGTIFVITEA